MSFRQGWALFIGLGVAGGCLADPEIMVHEGDLAERGELVATLHGNYTPKGDRRRDDGTWPTHRLTSLMAEFATGLAPGWEAGIHLPFMRAGIDSETSQRGDWGASAVMFRLKYIRRQDSGVFYGFNAEYDINAKRYVADPRSIEFRGIVGFDAEHFRVTANPHLIWGFGRSGGDRAPEFNIDWKALHKVGADFAWGAELYTDWGKAGHLHPGQGDRTLYLVSETETALGSLHLGIGCGYKGTPERTIVKLVWSNSF